MRAKSHVTRHARMYTIQLLVVKMDKEFALSNCEAKRQERIAVHNGRTLAGSGDTREVNDLHKQLSQNSILFLEIVGTVPPINGGTYTQKTLSIHLQFLLTQIVTNPHARLFPPRLHRPSSSTCC
ncbi:hypothetical protein CB0940_06055 [Cercospora beticola]|uniref:Uncharacterized protein n=1 Tax=Cercospora beticola TaxID=122368 RepID=A0A2G5I0I1_CERBT|nr:hypothetical protein CB0940_06055 [Cercospora beticola]PIA98002.1 hypothetical protein CB0940_06055 [Cercospora beticola]